MAAKESMYSCEAKKQFMRSGTKRWEWVPMQVDAAVRDEVTQFRCKDCHGSVKLFVRRVPNGPAPHIQHKLREDSEYCPSGIYFQQNPDREPRLSEKPVE